jgi:hypothetical protein
MTSIARGVAALGLAALALQAAAAEFDGSKPFICSVIDANDCALGTACIHELAEDINLPQFLKVDFAGKQLTARGKTAPILSSSRSNGMLVIQGVQARRSYSLTVSEETGDFVGAIAGDGEGFVVFGACTVP